MSADLIPAEAFQGDQPPSLTEAELEAYYVWCVEPGLQMSVDHAVNAEAIQATANVVKAWRIDGTNTAAWAMAKLAEADAELAGIAQQADEFHNRIDEWTEQQAKRPVRTREFFAGHLERYALWLREQSGVKTLNLPNGKVATRETAYRAVIEDADALLAWAEANDPDMIEVTKKVPVAKMRQRVTLVEVPTAVVMAQCGCIVDVEADQWQLAASYQVGTGMICAQCGQEALVGRWLDTTVLVAGDVPGVAVEPASVSATVKPEGVALERGDR